MKRSRLWATSLVTFATLLTPNVCGIPMKRFPHAPARSASANFQHLRPTLRTRTTQLRQQKGEEQQQQQNTDQVNGEPTANTGEQDNNKTERYRASSRFSNIRATQQRRKPRHRRENEEDEASTTMSRVLVEEMQESIDVSREGTRMDSLDSYIVVSCLTSTASFATVKSLSSSVVLAVDLPSVLHVSAVLVSTVSAFSGIYATVVFSLCAAYGRTSIGMGKDQMYESFMKGTGPLRAKGFDAYLLSLSLFLAEMVFISSTKLNDSPLLQGAFLVAATCVAVLMFRDWTNIMDLANPLFDMDYVQSLRLHEDEEIGRGGGANSEK